MPRLSLYRPEKGADFKLIDRLVNEQFQIGGTDINVHKYLGPVDPATGESSPGLPINSNPIPELGIQDLIFMENRDRHYDPDVYCLRGVYTMIDSVFNLAQFGLFLQNDELMIHFHLRGTVESVGRKLMAGDVIELPHQKDEYALDDAMVALKRFYVISEVTRPSTGYSATWYPHLLRAKCTPLVDSQEFKEILDMKQTDSQGNDVGMLRDIISTYNKSIEINNAIVAQAESDVLLSGYNTKSFYVIPTRESGIIDLADASSIDLTVDLDTAAMDASMILNSPSRNFYIGYMTDDGVPPNGAMFTSGDAFPSASFNGQFHLRTDYFPNRLFRWNGTHWIKYEDNVRMTMTNTADRQTQKTSFINNTNTATIVGEVIVERQALSKALKPRADN